jgi:dipeptidyl aminopeptidase/acylaminoacyl peptidase
MRLTAAAAGLVLSLSAMQAMAADVAQGTRTLAPDDFYRVQDVSDPQVSPDGQWVAYVVTTNDRQADEARSAIWMVSWDGSQRLALTSAADGTGKPRWSPDGRYLAFLSTPRRCPSVDGRQRRHRRVRLGAGQQASCLDNETARGGIGAQTLGDRCPPFQAR